MFNNRFITRLLLVIALVCSSLIAIPAIVSAQASPAQVCKFPFEATVQQGTSKGTSLSGDMTLNIDKDGSFTGQLVRKDNNTPIPVAGQVTGRAISLIMELAPMTDSSAGSYIYGTGVALEPIMANSDCGGPLGGTFTGPQADDFGSWASLTVCVNSHCVTITVKVSS